MVHHYHFISRLAAELGKVLKEAVLLSAFSQKKDELILEFEKNDGSGFILKAELQQGVGLLSFPDSFQRARGNAADLFPEIISQKIREVKPVLFDRSFHLVFDPILDDHHHSIFPNYFAQEIMVHYQYHHMLSKPYNEPSFHWDY